MLFLSCKSIYIYIYIYVYVCVCVYVCVYGIDIVIGFKDLCIGPLNLLGMSQRLEKALK